MTLFMRMMLMMMFINDDNGKHDDGYHGDGYHDDDDDDGNDDNGNNDDDELVHLAQKKTSENL